VKDWGLVQNLATPNKVQDLQRALHAKAKANPSLRFYSLYDKIYRKDVLWEAWRRCRANGGAPGIDEQTFERIESGGVEKWLGLLSEDLKAKTYGPQPIRRVYIPKPGGKKRPLGIGTIRDRVVQMAAVLVLQPIFEADLPDEQYGYRPDRNAKQAVQKIRSWIKAGHTEIVDADLAGYFDTIPHWELMKSVARRIADGAMLALVKGWLEAPVAELGKHGHVVVTNPGKRGRTGTPQGSPISPLLSNLYMRRLILAWKKLGYEASLKGRIVSYADDFVICCAGRGRGDAALAATRTIIERLKLSLNEEKTSVRDATRSSIDFLGYTIGHMHSWKGGRRFVGTKPSKKAIQRVCREISHRTRPAMKQMPVEGLIVQLNTVLNGWANYFDLGVVNPAYKYVEWHSRYRLRQWLRQKYKLWQVPKAKYTDGYLHKTLGLVKLVGRPRSYAVSEGDGASRSRA
jgi:RNA-directed DNA polymerase